ncbi:MAG TPA: sigma 54-interacting transcriptional regulator [Kofleriaceae bacterium]|nr:sigma 54-interacting transcriptional regulator [Kofleriaceae bacterium]
MSGSRRKPTQGDATIGRTENPTPVEQREVAAVGVHLLIVGPDHLATHSLPGSGKILLGRSDECDVPIDDVSISRKHAQLHLGPQLLIEDLGSANGTVCAEKRLEPNQPVPVRLGEPIQLGGVTLILQRRLPIARPRRIWDHGYFEGHVEEECSRTVRTGRGFAIVFARAETGQDARALEEQLSIWFRTADVIGRYGPGEFEVLLVDVSPPDAAAVTKKLSAALADQHVRVDIGLACYPLDGRDPHTLLSVAASRARGTAQTDETMPIVVRDPIMQDLYRLASVVAKSEIAVILLGETGTGKEVLAEAIHRGSQRAPCPFLRLNCAALTETLLESELFGHEKGAFTGASAAKTGLLESAAGGTVFLDEIGELPMSTQVKLLRVIEERKVLPVGAIKQRPILVRFIAATNRDLENEVVRGTFRRDLYFRLNGFSLVIPPLRDRPLDVDALAHVFLERFAKRAGYARQPRLSAECLDVLGNYSWPGNVRELRNVIERAVVLCQGGDIAPEHLPLEKIRHTMPVQDAAPTREPRLNLALRPSRLPARGPSDEVTDPALRPLEELAPAELRELVTQAERKRIEDALARCAGNQTRAAERLGMARRTLVKKLVRYGIARPRK